MVGMAGAHYCCLAAPYVRRRWTGPEWVERVNSRIEPTMPRFYAGLGWIAVVTGWFHARGFSADSRSGRRTRGPALTPFGLRKQSWGGEDSNLRPADYESAHGNPDDLDE
jgi:hypothetical protein